MTKDPKVIEHWITLVNEEGRNLSKWQLEFMRVLTKQFEKCNWINNNQEEILERIYADKTS